MNLDEWYLEYEQLTHHHQAEIRKHIRLLPTVVRQSQPEPSPDDVVASTNKPDVPGQERLNLHDPLDLIV